MRKQTEDSISPQIAAMGFVCVILAGLVVVLGMKVRSLSADVVRLEAQALAQQPNRDGFAAGEVVAPMTLVDPQGVAVPLSFEPGAGSTLLLISNKSCRYCEDARPIWDRIAGDPRMDGIRIVELVLDASPEHLQQSDYPYEVYTPGEDVIRLLSRIPVVPAAILIGERGVVVQGFYGEQTGLESVVMAYAADDDQ